MWVRGGPGSRQGRPHLHGPRHRCLSGLPPEGRERVSGGRPALPLVLVPAIAGGRRSVRPVLLGQTSKPLVRVDPPERVSDGPPTASRWLRHLPQSQPPSSGVSFACLNTRAASRTQPRDRRRRPRVPPGTTRAKMGTSLAPRPQVPYTLCQVTGGAATPAAVGPGRAEELNSHGLLFRQE